MARRLLDWDPLSGMATYHSYDPATRMRTIEEVQDVSPIIEANKLRRNNEDKAQQIRAGWWQVGSLPFSIIYKWMREDGVNVMDRGTNDFLDRKLRDPEYRYLTTTTGRW